MPDPRGHFRPGVLEACEDVEWQWKASVVNYWMVGTGSANWHPAFAMLLGGEIVGSGMRVSKKRLKPLLRC